MSAYERDETADEQESATERLTQAARNSAFGQVAESDSMSAGLLIAMGGWRGIIEALIPGIVFLVVFVVTSDLWLSVAAPAVLGALFVIVRLVRREPVSSALGGLIGLVLSGFLAVRSGEGANYFVVGLWSNAIYAVGVLISMLLRWPIIGIIAGYLFGDGTNWRRNRRMLLWLQLVTGAWFGLFVLRLAVQLPLFLAGEVEALAVAKLLLGLPLFGLLMVLTVLFVRAIYRVNSGNPNDKLAAEASEGRSI